MDATGTIILVGSTLLIASVLTSVVALRVGAPLLLIFLAVGLVAGSDGLGGIPFDDAPTAFLIGSIALAVILFESGFDTKLSAYRSAAWPALALATGGVVVTGAVIGAAARGLLGLGWIEGLLLGAVVSSTDAAAVFLLLRVGGITIRERVRSTLEIESGSNDPMAVLLTVILVELARSGGTLGPGWIVLEFLRQLGGGLALGLIGGIALVVFINGTRLEANLRPVVSLTFALFIFGSTTVLGASGFLAVYIAGLVAGNTRMRGAEGLRRFHAGLTWLSQIVMFVMLGLLATPREFGTIWLPAVGLALLLILVARPLAVAVCLLPFRFSTRETIFVGWVGLRGAVSILLALVPVLGEVPGGQTIFNTAFLVVIVSLLVQGWTIRPMARRLGLIVPPRTGLVQRVDLELPGEITHDLVAYTVHPASAVARGQALPRWARPSLVLREGRVVPLHRARPLQARDTVYLFIGHRRLALLDKLFGGTRVLDQDDREFYGDLVLQPGASIELIAQMYGLPVTPAQAGRTLAELFSREFGQGYELGDRLRVGEVELIVRDMAPNGAITSIGLALEPAKSWRGKPAFPLRFPPHPGRLLARVARGWRQRWSGRRSSGGP